MQSKQVVLVLTILTGAAALLTPQPAQAAVASSNLFNILTGAGSSNSNTNNNNNNNNSNSTNTDDQHILLLPNFTGNNFLVVAAADSLLEIQLGMVAQTNSTNWDIQLYGQMLVNDHTPTYEQAQALATNGITLRPLNRQEQGVVRYFQSLHGEQFDRVFIRYLIQTHVQDISRYEMAALRSWNRDLRVYAANNLPMLMRHLTTALDIRETLLGNPALSSP